MIGRRAAIELVRKKNSFLLNKMPKEKMIQLLRKRMQITFQ